MNLVKIKIIWILLLMCFCNITIGNGEKIPSGDKSKFINKMARRILDEIKSGKEQVNKGRDSHFDFVTNAVRKQAISNKNYSFTTDNPYGVKAIGENKHTTQRDKSTSHNLKPLKAADRVPSVDFSVIKVNPVTDKSFEKSTLIPKTDKNNMNNLSKNINSDYVMKTESSPVSLFFNESIVSDESETSRVTEHNITIPESDVNVTVVPPLVKSLYLGNTSKLILRSLKNNKKPLEHLSYLAPNFSHLKKVKSEEYNSFTKLPSLNVGKHNKNVNRQNNLDGNHILFSNRYIKMQKNNYTSSEKNSETDAVTIPTQNFSKNRIDLTFINNLNINSYNKNSYNDYAKIGQDNNKTNNNYQAYNLVNETVTETETVNETAQYKTDNNDRSISKILLKRPFRRPRFNVANKIPSNKIYISTTDAPYLRHSENSKRLKVDVTPISVDYYFDRIDNNQRSDYSDEVYSESELEQAVVVNFDQNADAMGRSRNEVMLNVLRDMIGMDSKPIVEYPWLKSVLEVRSGILKIIDLIDTYVYNHHIHPLDLELMKYLLYLHKSSSMKLQSERSPYIGAQLSQLSMNPKQGPRLTNQFKNVNKDGYKSLGEADQAAQDQQLTMLFDLQDFLNEVFLLLDAFHRKIQELAEHDPHSHLYTKLKEEYFQHAKDHHLRVVLLHLALARLFQYIDSSAARVKDGFYNYVQQHPEEVKRDKEEIEFVMNVLDQLRWK